MEFPSPDDFFKSFNKDINIKSIFFCHPSIFLKKKSVKNKALVAQMICFFLFVHHLPVDSNQQGEVKKKLVYVFIFLFIMIFLLTQTKKLKSNDQSVMTTVWMVE